MARRQSPLRKLINPRRIAIPILFGLAVVAWMLYSNLTDVRFEEASCGGYDWVDGNDNGIVDLTDKEDFVINPDCGEYRKSTYTEMLAGIDWGFYTFLWIAAAMVMMLLRAFGYMVRIKVLTDGALTWRQAFDVIILWEFASAVTPSVIGGAPVAIYLLSKEKIPVGKSTAIVMVTSLMDEIFFIVVVALIYFLVPLNELFPPMGDMMFFNAATGVKVVFWVSYALICLYSLFVMFGIFINPYFIRRIIILLFSLPLLKRWKEGATRAGDEVVVASVELKGKPFSYWVKAFIATFLSWTSRYLVVNCLIMAFLATNEHFLIYARQLVMWVIMLISPTPGSSGVAEYSFAVFLREFIPTNFEGAVALIWRLISYYSYLILGALILPRWLKRVYTQRKSVRFSDRKKA